jgi:AcrR family transcriptional regulator
VVGYNDPVSEPVRAAKQQRSRETLARLLEATIATVSKHGISGATVPRIAAAAKVAPASVYRRFQDKESLLRAAFLDFLEHSIAASAAAVPALTKGRTLEWIAGAVARSLIQQYRLRPTLMRALVHFLETDNDPDFRQRALALIARNAESVIGIIVSRFGKQIAHKNVRRAVTFVSLLISTAAETRALEKFSLWTEMLPLSDDELAAELKRVFLVYLLKQP